MTRTRALSFVLLCAALTAAWRLAETPHGHRGPDLVVAEYAFFLAAALSGTFIVERFGNAIALAAETLQGKGLAACGVVLLAVLTPVGLYQFGGFDHSTVILSGWIVRSGLVPFRDVPCTVAPLFVMGSTAAMSVFGVHWWAFVAVAGAFAIVTFIWLVSQLMAGGVPAGLAVALALVAELSTMMVGGFWWYNPISSIAVVLVFASSLACLRESRGWWSWASLAGAFGILLLVKPNAWPVGACLAVLAITKQSDARVKAVTAGVAGAAGAAAFCFAYGFSPSDVLRAYGEVAATRGTPFSLIVFSEYPAIEQIYLLVIIFAMAGVWLVWLGKSVHACRSRWRECACCGAAGLTSLWMAFTNYELKTSDLAPLLLAVAVLGLQPWGRRHFTIAARRVVAVMMLGCVVASLYWSVTRYRVRGIGEGMFFQYPASIRISSGFFEGLTTGPRLVAVVEQTEDVLRRHPGTVFFGPRMEFLYAVFNRPPGKGLPLFWHPGSAYPEAAIPAIVQAFSANRFDTLVFLRGDATRMPVSLLREIAQSYVRVTGYDELTVFRLKADSRAGDVRKVDPLPFDDQRSIADLRVDRHHVFAEHAEKEQLHRGDAEQADDDGRDPDRQPVPEKDLHREVHESGGQADDRTGEPDERGQPQRNPRVVDDPLDPQVVERVEIVLGDAAHAPGLRIRHRGIAEAKLRDDASEVRVGVRQLLQDGDESLVVQAKAGAVADLFDLRKAVDHRVADPADGEHQR
jgi:hypothetical protein